MLDPPCVSKEERLCCMCNLYVLEAQCSGEARSYGGLLLEAMSMLLCCAACVVLDAPSLQALFAFCNVDPCAHMQSNNLSSVS